MQTRRRFPAIDVLAFSFLYSLVLSAAAHAATRSLADITSIWKNPSVEICFGDSSTEVSKHSSVHSALARSKNIVDHSPYESRIQALLEREYTADRTGIRFTGFSSCDSAKSDAMEAPAFIFADLQLPEYGISSVGDERLDLKSEEQGGLLSGSLLDLTGVANAPEYSVGKLAQALAKLADSPEDADAVLAASKKIDEELVNDQIDVTILHELGHLSGLLHEEARKDVRAGQPDWCRLADDAGKQKPETERTLGTEFDPFSVMNYCADDIAKGFAFYHLLCTFPELSKRLGDASSFASKLDWDAVRPYCGFMRDRPYPVGLSERDQAALRKLYLGQSIPAGSRSYRSNPDEVRTISALQALYDSLSGTYYLREAVEWR